MCLDLKATLVILAPVASKEQGVAREPQELLVTLVCRDPLEIRDKQGLKALLDRRELQVKLVALDFLDQLGPLD